MQQFELNFDESPEDRIVRLKATYLAQVGVPSRTNNPDEIEAALVNPIAERARLTQVDADADKEDLARPYRG